MKICIFLFSGTGMTRYVTGRVQLELEKKGALADVFNIENMAAESMDLAGYDAVGVAYPVHSFNAPEIVIDFARGLPKVEKKRAFILSTAGGDTSLNFSSSRLLKKILRKKGFDVFYDRQFIMPSNFIVRDSDKKVGENISEVNEKAPETAQDIINSTAFLLKSGLFARLITFLGRAEWFGTKRIGKFFYADNRCSRCGACADSCPNGNITVTPEQVSFKAGCGLCMRCFYVCPNNCLLIRQPFKSLKIENWYDGHQLSSGAKQRLP